MTHPAVEAQHEAQVKEYGTWIATGPIDIYGARAFNTGDPVPASHIDNNIVPQHLVARVTTKAAQAAINGEG